MSNHLYFVLQIRSEKYSIEKISEVLNLNPILRTGSTVVIVHTKKRVWSIDTRDLSEMDINNHWKLLKAKLPRSQIFQKLFDHCTVKFFIRGTFETMSPLIEFSNKTLSEISEYGLPLGYDIYDLTE